MVENFKNGDSDAWTKLYDTRDPEELKRLITSRGFQATCDWPSSTFWEEQMKAFPDAKVVLAVRDPEKWYESFIHTVAYMFADMQHCPFGVRVLFGLGLPARGFSTMTRKLLLHEAFKGDLSKENVIKCYKEHVEYVKRVCPKEKLFLFDIKDGWGPLCEFLGKPVPNEPFPNVNESAHFQSMADRMNMAGHVVNILGLGIPSLYREKSTVTETEKMSEKVESKLSSKWMG